MRRPLWMLGQALAVGGLTWFFWSNDASAYGGKNIEFAGALFLAVVIVAFATALLTNFGDWLWRKITGAGRAGRAGRTVAPGPKPVERNRHLP